MVREFHRVIGVEARAQMIERTGRLPDAVAACVGGGSNAIGIFTAFVGDPGVQLVGLEAGGEVTPMYDPMVAKLIVWDADREQATARMLRTFADRMRAT